MRRFETLNDRKENNPFHGEENFGFSMTEQGQAYTIPQLLEKYRIGLNPPVHQYMDFDDGRADFDDIDPSSVPGFDPVDYCYVLDDGEQRLDVINSRVNQMKLNALLERSKAKESEANEQKKDPSPVS